jgi:hypothetical protein
MIFCCVHNSVRSPRFLPDGFVNLAAKPLSEARTPTIESTRMGSNQLVELGAFLRAQPYYVLLDGNLFPDHESPPSLPCSDGGSEVAVIFNDGSD